MELLNPLANSQYAAQSASFTGTAGSTAGWAAGPDGVVIWADSPCYVIVGEGVTATTSNGTPIPANTPIPFKVPQGTGATWRVSAIQISAGGTVYCKPVGSR